MTTPLTVSEATTARDTAQVGYTAALRAQFANKDKGTDAEEGRHQMLVSLVRWANEDLVHAERVLYLARKHAGEV